MTNEQIAHELCAHAAGLARTGDNLYRVRAYRQAAFAVLALPLPVTDYLGEGGVKQLKRVPGIGASLAKTVADLANGVTEADTPLANKAAA